MTALPQPPRAYIGARLIDPSQGLDTRGGVLTASGRIVETGPHVTAELARTAGAVIVDCRGACLVPGLVDLRVTTGEPGEEHKETIATAAAAAAAGGVTTFACLPSTDPPVDTVEALEFIARRARGRKGPKVFAHACVTRGRRGADLAEMGLLAEAGAVGFSDGDRAVADPVMMARALAYAAAHDRPVLQHPQEPRLAGAGQMHAGELATRLGLPGIPREAEVIQIERDLRLVTMAKGRLHLGPVTTREGVEAIRAAKARGVAVTADTAPFYVTLTETDVGDYRTFAKLSPPLRTDDDRAAVIAGLADGTIDALTSDHRPQDVDSKRLPFTQAEPGMVGLETLLVLSLDLVHRGHLSLPRLIAALTDRPASILNVPAGTLRPQSAADLLLLDPDRPGRIAVDRFHSKSKNSLYDGRPVMGRVLRTVVDGRTVYDAPDD